jgi:predicted flap endonuclease-1-like 5' DNA nuclease
MELLLFFIIGLICLVIGFFLGKASVTKKFTELKESNEDLSLKLDMCKAKNSTLTATLNKDRSSFKNESLSLINQTNKIKTKEIKEVDIEEIKKLYGKKVELNDFKIIDGIGPKLEELLKQSGIITWLDLANTSANTLKEFLSNFGNRFTLHDPSAWPKQAELMCEGKWDALKTYQEKLHKGKEV